MWKEWRMSAEMRFFHEERRDKRQEVVVEEWRKTNYVCWPQTSDRNALYIPPETRWGDFNPDRDDLRSLTKIFFIFILVCASNVSVIWLIITFKKSPADLCLDTTLSLTSSPSSDLMFWFLLDIFNFNTCYVCVFTKQFIVTTSN